MAAVVQHGNHCPLVAVNAALTDTMRASMPAMETIQTGILASTCISIPSPMATGDYLNLMGLKGPCAYAVHHSQAQVSFPVYPR